MPQALRLNHPYLQAGNSRGSIQYPRNVIVETQSIFQILSHATRLPSGQSRVIGTLLGTRSEDGFEVEVKSAYIIPMSENGDEVTIDVDYYGEMYALYKRSFPDLQIVGWYSTSPELNNVTGLIHDLFSKENGTAPHPPIHLTVDIESVDIQVQSYVSLPIHASQENLSDGNCILAPVETTVNFTESDLSVLALTSERGVTKVNSLPTSTDDAIEQTLQQIDLALEKVAAARTNPSAESEELARYLYKVVSTAPALEAPSTAIPHKLQSQGLKYDPRSAMYNAHMRDLMSLMSLTSSIRWQVQLNSDVSSSL